jgi:hypothetical protein
VGLRTGLDKVKKRQIFPLPVPFIYIYIYISLIKDKSTFSVMYKARKYICTVMEILTHVFHNYVQFPSGRTLLQNVASRVM